MDKQAEALRRKAELDRAYHIEDIQRQLSDWRREYRGKEAPLPAVAQYERLEDELRELLASQQKVEGFQRAPTLEEKLEFLNDAVFSLYPVITSLRRFLVDWQATDMQARTARNKLVDRWILALAILIAVAYGVLMALAVQVYWVQ